MSEILFILNCYDEPIQQILQAIESLRAFYSTAPLIIIWDAPDLIKCLSKMETIQDNYKGIKQRYYRHRLKPLINGGGWTYRYLYVGREIAKKHPYIKYLLQIEPETLFLKKIESDLPKEGIFTKVIDNNNKTFIQGGAIGYNLAAVQTIVDSNLLLNKEFKQLKYGYKGEKDYFRNTHISCQDSIVYEVATRLKIPVANFDDFSCYPHFMKNKIDYTKSVIHPVSTKEVINAQTFYSYSR